MSKGNSIVTCNCPDCNQSLNYYLQQPMSPNSKLGSYWIGTCENKDCTLWKVTLSDDSWTKLASDSDMAEMYRKMVANRREQDAILEAKFAALYGGAK